jgi:hypothetical protein
MAHSLFYKEFSPHYLLRQHLENPAKALRVNMKNAHTRPSFYVNLELRQTWREWVGDIGQKS